jgi:hypothetical protein
MAHSIVVAAVIGTFAATSVQLQSEFLRATVQIDPAGTCVAALSASLSLAFHSGWTPNLLTGLTNCGSPASSSLLELSSPLSSPAGQLLTSVGGTLTFSNATSVHITGIQLGNAAFDDWNITLVNAALLWAVKRTYVSDGVAVSDQAQALWLQTTSVNYDAAPALYSNSSARGNSPFMWQSQVQIPSFLSLDSDLLDSSTGTGYRTAASSRIALLGDSTTGDARRVILSPSGMALHISNSACRFAMYRPASVFVQQIGLGAECATGPGGAYSFSKGDIRTSSLVADFRPATQGHGYFDFSVPANTTSNTTQAAWVVQQARLMASTFTLPMGWIAGNSPQCETCVHEISIFPQLQGMFRSVAPPAEPSISLLMGGIDGIPAVTNCSGSQGACPTLQDATAKQMDFLLSNSVNASGYVAPRWSIVNGNDLAFGGIIDQFPHMLLAAYYHALNTNDSAKLQSWMPTLDTIASYMMTSMDANITYLLTNTNPACDGTANFSCADNYWDDVRFGWHDAIVDAYAVEAFRRFADLKQWLGDSAGAASYRRLYSQMLTAYNTEFWDAGLGAYHDWVDKQGNRRSYFYTWQQFAAIEFGIASQAQANLIMTTRDRLYASIEQQYNLTAGSLFCPPSNLIPISPLDLTVDFDNEYHYGHYENGCIFHWMCGIEMQALARVRGPQAAYDRLVGALTVFNTTRLWGQRWGWLENSPLGADVINDALFLVYGGLFGALNIRTSLLGGIEVLGPSVPALEGASFTFGLLGRDITVTVQNGWAKVL